MTPEQRANLARAAMVYNLATGLGDAASLEALQKDPAKLDAVADALDAVAGGTSPLAFELRNLPRNQKTAVSAATGAGE